MNRVIFNVITNVFCFFLTTPDATTCFRLATFALAIE